MQTSFTPGIYLKMAPESSEQTLAFGQPIKTINSAYRNDPSWLYDGGQAPVSVQALWTSPVLTGMPRRWPPTPTDTSQGLEKAPPFSARLRCRCRARGRPTKSSRPCGVCRGPQDYQRPDSAPPTPIGLSPAVRTTAAILPRRSGCGSGPGAGRGGLGRWGSLAEGGEGRS